MRIPKTTDKKLRINLNKLEKCTQNNAEKTRNHLKVIRIRIRKTTYNWSGIGKKHLDIPIRVAAADGAAAILVALTRRLEMWTWFWQNVWSGCVCICAANTPNANTFAIKETHTNQIYAWKWVSEWVSEWFVSLICGTKRYESEEDTQEMSIAEIDSA